MATKCDSECAGVNRLVVLDLSIPTGKLEPMAVRHTLMVIGSLLFIMPSPKRWFRVSHELPFADQEVWLFTDEFGDRALRTWLWMLSQLNQTDNAVRFPEEHLPALARQLRQSSANVRRQVGWMLAKGWLTAGQLSASGWPSLLTASNYQKYNKVRNPVSSPTRLDLTLHDLTKEKKEKEGLSSFRQIIRKYGEPNKEKS